MNFACLAAAVVTVAAAKKNSYSETLCAVSFSTFYCNYDSVTFFFDCGSLIACSIGWCWGLALCMLQLKVMLILFEPDAMLCKHVEALLIIGALFLFSFLKCLLGRNSCTPLPGRDSRTDNVLLQFYLSLNGAGLNHAHYRLIYLHSWHCRRIFPLCTLLLFGNAGQLH